MQVMEPAPRSPVKVGEIQPNRKGGVITWGRTIPLGDFEAQDITIANLHFRAIDFGDTVRLSERGKIALVNTDAFERNQCVLIHTVAGAQWAREGRRNGVPILSRVLAEAEEWRQEEFNQAMLALAAVGQRKDLYAAEVASVAHDALGVGDDRDYRSFVLFYRDLIIRNKISIRVFDVRHRVGGGYVLTDNLFVGSQIPEGQTMLIDLIAYKHHMRWVKICEDNLMADVRDWEKDFEEHLRIFVVDGWGEKLEVQVEATPNLIVTLDACRFCKKN